MHKIKDKEDSEITKKKYIFFIYLRIANQFFLITLRNVNLVLRDHPECHVRFTALFDLV